MDASPGNDTPPVIAQELKNLRVPGKIATVLWTLRSDRCTMQVVLTIPGSEGRVVALPKGKQPARPSIELWLLGPEGEVIARHYRWDSPSTGSMISVARPTGAEINFQFPRDAARVAVAAVLRVDSEYRVEAINRLVG